MPTAESFYQAASGYHATQLEVPEVAYALMAAERARKIQPAIEPRWRVLEYGVGTGLNLAAVKCQSRWGFDIAAHLGPALAGRGIQFFPAMAQVPGESVEAVLCHHALEHVPSPVAALTEMHRVLAPQGLLLLYVPYEREARYRSFRPDEPNHHLYSWNPQTLGNLVETAGFAVEQAHCGPTGYERFAAVKAAQWGWPPVAHRALLSALRLIQPVEEVRVVARKR